MHLNPESYDEWLSEAAKVEDVRNLLVPYPSSEMRVILLAAM